jgi:hypothetical protein
MKVFLASLATVALLCVAVLVRSAFAQVQPNFNCEHISQGGCSFEPCVLAEGNCPPGGDNPNAPYNHATYSTTDIYTCVPVGNGCNQNARQRTFCSVLAYNVPDEDCNNLLCAFDETVGQCVQ